ncbi:MAG: hypothetical protein RL512_448, partial [Bacteroidota bacterium]
MNQLIELFVCLHLGYLKPNACRMKPKLTWWASLFVCLLLSINLWAQNKPISGRIFNKATGESVAGATVTL